MRTLTLLVLTAALGCGESKETDSNQPEPAESKTPGAGEAEPDDTKVAKKPKPKPALLDCDPWLAPDLLKTHCGVDLPLAKGKSSVGTDYTCGRSAKGEGGSRIDVSIAKLFTGKLAPVHRRRYPDPPKLEKSHSNIMTVKGRKFPYLLTVGSGGKPLCTDEQIMALTNAVLAKIPASEEPTSKENKACDALLTAVDIKSKCGREGKVNATMMEDGKSLYCNRGGSGLIFIVSKHASNDLAKRGAEVAREDTAAGVAHKGPYSIEMKSSMGSNTCNKAGLDALAKLVAERL